MAWTSKCFDYQWFTNASSFGTGVAGKVYGDLSKTPGASDEFMYWNGSQYISCVSMFTGPVPPPPRPH